MVSVTELSDYADENGNVISFPGVITEGIRINFRGSNNRLTVAAGARLGKLTLDFDCENGIVEIGKTKWFTGNIRVGQDSKVTLGNDVSTTRWCVISATEGTTVAIGDDVMFSSDNQIRADDAHPIFDVRSGKRVNISKSITIGNHVWLALGVAVLGGVTIGDGTVVGYGSVVTKSLPNNCVAVGIPAKVMRRNTAWERPHLSLEEPFYKPHADTVKRSRYWALTNPDETLASSHIKGRLRSAVRHLVRQSKA